MVREAKLGKEIVVTVANKVGALADISRILADRGINIESAAGYAQGTEARIMLATEDNLRASDALKKAGYKSLKEEEILILSLENKVGALKEISEKLVSAGIDIKQIYGTTCSADCPAKMVLMTSDNEKALVTLKRK